VELRLVGTARGLYLEALASATDARAQVERIYGDLDGLSTPLNSRSNND
jgi:cobalt-zinc-cadmium efflux system outer membrane protein